MQPDQRLQGLRVAMIATDGVEQAELTEPAKALSQAGAKVDLISIKTGRIQAVNHMDKGETIAVDLTLEQANPDQYGALLLPGGAVNADALRMHPKVQDFIRKIDQAGKPMAVICHAPWELISAGRINGRTLTSYSTIQDDLRNAGATWKDEEVVVDGNLVTSRQPSDIPAFNREMLALFGRHHQSVQNQSTASLGDKSTIMGE